MGAAHGALLGAAVGSDLHGVAQRRGVVAGVGGGGEGGGRGGLRVSPYAVGYLRVLGRFQARGGAAALPLCRWPRRCL